MSLPLNFPTSPVNGEQYTNATTGATYQYVAAYDYWKYVPADTNVRIGTEVSSATSTPTSDTVDQWNVTALAEADAFAAPTGTPLHGQKLMIRIKDNGTARALSWNAIYRAGTDISLPTTTVLSKTIYLGFIYNSTDTKWDLIGKVNNI